MPHANALLSERGRLRLAAFHVESGSTIRATAERFQTSTTTVVRWSRRYRAVLASGRIPTEADMADRSSRPRRCPNQTPRKIEKRIRYLRTKHRLGPVQIAGRVGVPASTVHRVLVRAGLNRLANVDRATGEPVRPCERQAPGELVHVDVKKFGLVPAGGGWKVHGRGFTGSEAAGRANTADQARRGTGRRGYAYVHSAIDDHSRLAYSEVHDDETAVTTCGFWTRAVAFFAEHGITVERVMTDNGPNYCSRVFAHLLAEQSIQHKRTRPYRPQTNGKVERYQRTMRDEWGYGKAYACESSRCLHLIRFDHSLLGDGVASRLQQMGFAVETFDSNQRTALG